MRTKILRIILIGFVLFLNAPSGFSIQTNTKQWSLYTLNGNYGSTLYYIEPQFRLIWRDRYFQQFLANTGVGYQTSFPLQFWFGQTVGTTSQDVVAGSFEEYRLWQQISWNVPGIPSPFISRARLEERKSFDYPDWAFRFRERLVGTYPIGDNFWLEVGDEIFFRLNEVQWVDTQTLDQNRAYLGGILRVSKNMFLALGYMNQYISTRETQVDNVFVVNLRTYLVAN